MFGSTLRAKSKIVSMKRILFLILLFPMSLGLLAQEFTIAGRVILASDQSPLPGVSVVAAGTTTGTITDFDGRYSLTVPPSARILRFTFVGLQTEEIEIGDLREINVSMVQGTEELDEVVVIGYGSKRKGSITGSVSTIGSDKIEQIPVANLDAMMQGQVAGMQVITNSGAPGAGSTIRIRGVSSLNAGTYPLYIMDGVQVTAGDFSALNPNDIENISVLKDASATSIYGSKGANGVIIITTKRGRNNQETEINYRMQAGMSVIARDQFDMMDSDQKIDYEIDLGIRDPNDPENEKLRGVNTNWRDEVFRNAPMNSHELSVRGGNERTAFFITGGYFYQEGIQYRSDLRRYTARINLDHRASRKLGVGFYLSGGYETNQNPVLTGNNVYNLAFRAYLENPYVSPYKDDGSYSQQEDGLLWANPIEQLELNDNENTDLKMIGKAYLDYEIIPSLTFRSTVGGDFSDAVGKSYINPESVWGAENGGEVYRSFGRSFRLTNTNLLTFSKEYESHNLGAYVGQESVSYDYEDFESEGFGLPNSIVKVLSTTATPGDSWSGGISQYSVLSFFGNASYDFDRKYFADVSYRRDGSSRFGPESRWADFWSLGAQWDIKREGFMDHVEFLTRLKLRGSIGTAGNYNIGNYNHQQTYAFNAIYYDRNASYPAEPGNPGLTWEKVRLSSLALDFQLASRLGFIVELYHKLTTDMLSEVPYSFTSGFSGGWDNIGKMVNEGIEFTADLDLMRTSELLVNINTNFAYNHNEILELYGVNDEVPPSADSDWIHAVGRPYGSWKMVEYIGVNAANGERLFLDVNGEPTNEFLVSNARFQGKSWVAPWQGGFTASVSYRGLSASAFFTWVYGKYMVNNTRYFTESNGQFAFANQSTAMLRAWKEPGDITDIPRADGVNYFSTQFLEDASFARFKNLTLAYTLPEKWSHATRVFRSLRVYAQGQNLVTWTRYQGFDPETDGPYELGLYPHVKTFTIGIDAAF
jgi:TonB-linked SusC/RagA family outer membrane protein